MHTFTLLGFLADVEHRKAQLEIDESAGAVNALRNKGRSRTAAKRAILQRARDRARLAGVKPVRSYA